VREALRRDCEAQLSIESHADFERQKLRRIEFGVHRLIFSTKMATWRCAERLKYGAIAISADAKRHGAMRDARCAIALDARRHGALLAATSIRDLRSKSGA
jgi:hypothetical protein